MARHDYIPSRQLELRTFVSNFDRVVGSGPERFGLMRAEWQSLHERIAGFTQALEIALHPESRNVGSIAAKSLARALMLELLRPIAQRIRDNLGVSLEDKLTLGLTPPGRGGGPIPAPQTAPVLRINLQSGLAHLLNYHDEAMPDRAARATGATGLMLFRLLGPPPAAGQMSPPQPPSGPESAQFLAQVTRQHHRIQYDPADAWKTAHYWARWQTARGLLGPWSAVATRVVAA